MTHVRLPSKLKVAAEIAAGKNVGAAKAAPNY